MNLLKKNEKTNLYNGVEIPINAFGCYNLEPGEDTYNAVVNAIESGYRHIDTAWSYHNEVSVGQAIRDCISRGIIKREDIFVTTKLTDPQQGYYNAIKAFEASMQNLGLGYIDCWLIHTPGRHYIDWQTKLVDTWLAMENIYNTGKVRSIGVSQFEEKHLALLESKTTIKPMINQLELHPMVQQKELVQYCKNKGITIGAWGALNRGEVNKNSLLIQIAKEYNKTVPQICLRWSVQKGFLPISRTRSKEHCISNNNIFDFELSSETMTQIDSLDYGNSRGSAYGEYRDVTPYDPNESYASAIFYKSVSYTRTYKLFNLIPVLKEIKYKWWKSKWFLFGIIPILKISTSDIIPKKESKQKAGKTLVLSGKQGGG